jgi:predicted ATPase
MLFAQISKLELKGFKSIRELRDLEFRPINILVGANGVGKSNFISFFKMLSYMTGSENGLQDFVFKYGGANSLLHDGAQNTDKIEASLTIKSKNGENDYLMRLSYAAPDTLVFIEERYRFSPKHLSENANWSYLESGRRNSALLDKKFQNQTVKVILSLMRQCKVYQFHNTSETARIRQYWNTEQHRYLLEDAANLAPFLLRLREDESTSYQRIVETLRQIAPFFDDFILEPYRGSILLKWREKGSDLEFGAHQASDGTLRTMALISLLLQPEHDMPLVLILDEPELGLHPYAIDIVAGLLKSASLKSQVFVATQSMPLLNYFDPEDVIVVDRVDRESKFHRLNSEELKSWLEEYSLSDLLEKNVIGGNPQ